MLINRPANKEAMSHGIELYLNATRPPSRRTPALASSLSTAAGNFVFVLRNCIRAALELFCYQINDEQHRKPCNEITAHSSSSTAGPFNRCEIGQPGRQDRNLLLVDKALRHKRFVTSQKVRAQ